MDSDLAPKIGDVTSTITMKYLVKGVGKKSGGKVQIIFTRTEVNSKGSQNYTRCVITFALDIFKVSCSGSRETIDITVTRGTLWSVKCNSIGTFERICL